ncbi:MAG: hypothetical protein AVDCRST_MAG06-317 [uncultured Nocardioides sp.]|uniref:Uncharacterized protein n=1 Tax=uncultured Nocardioides sp. TaxID=198441 RepID=A0A6J4N0B5_9ACTN|nr:MAG: hypothetical protein AVDCRST_MAG06-317 [uncultured Nocardioides sp.]
MEPVDGEHLVGLGEEQGSDHLREVGTDTDVRTWWVTSLPPTMMTATSGR